MAYKIDELIKSGTLTNLILLYGEEDYLKRQKKDAIINSLLSTKDSMNLSKFVNYSGRKEESDRILPELTSIAATLPFFSPCRIIVCENTGFFKNKFDGIVDMLSTLPDTTYIIFIESEISRATKACKYVIDNGFLEEYNLPEPSALKAWINHRVKSAGLDIDVAAINEFFERCGNKTGNDKESPKNMDNMDRELEKLICYKLNDRRITVEDVKAICINSIETIIWNITNAVASRNKNAAMAEYAILAATKANSRYVLTMLTREYQKILAINMALNSGMSNDAICKSLKISPYALKHRISAANNFSTASLKKILALSAQTLRQMNTGLLGEQTGIEMFLIKSLKA